MSTAQLLLPRRATNQCSTTLADTARAPESRSWPAVSRGIALSLLAGGFHAVSWLLPGVWPAAWIGQSLLIFVAATHPPRAAFWYGIIGGALGIALSFYWGIAALQMTIDANLPLAYGIFSALVLVEGLSFAIFCLLTSLARRGGIATLCIVPFAWATVEAWYPRIFPWQLGYSQLELIPLIQIAELTGSIGIGFVMTAVTAVPTIVYLAWHTPGPRCDRRYATVYASTALVLLVTTLAYGEIRRQQWAGWLAGQPKMTIAAIQVDPAFLGAEEKFRHWTLSICQDVDLICWPESSIGVYSEALQHFRDVALTRTLSRESWNSLEPNNGYGKHLLAGGKVYRANADEHGPYSMTAFLIGPQQDILGRYRKRTLLPFGEYVPGQSFYPAIREWFTIRDVIEAGRDPEPLVMQSGERLGVLICYEDTLPENARLTAAAGAQAFLSLIQGTAFENPLTLRQHQRLAVMRAVENRRYFVRCASTGVTCVVDPLGHVLSELPTNSEGVLRCEISLVDSQAIYTRAGNLFAWLCTAVTAVSLPLALRRRLQ